MKECTHNDLIQIVSTLETKIAVIDEKLLATADTLKNQAKEYERRLGELNHEAARIKEIQATYLPREVYENNHKELTTKVEKIIDWQGSIIGRENGLSLGWKILIGGLGFITAVGSLALLLNALRTVKLGI